MTRNHVGFCVGFNVPDHIFDMIKNMERTPLPQYVKDMIIGFKHTAMKDYGITDHTVEWKIVIQQ